MFFNPSTVFRSPQFLNTNFAAILYVGSILVDIFNEILAFNLNLIIQ